MRQTLDCFEVERDGCDFCAHSDSTTSPWLVLATRQLPVEFLADAVLNVKHRLLTRKMAIELLTRADAARMESLQPRLMRDPEADLRYPAVDKGCCFTGTMAA